MFRIPRCSAQISVRTRKSCECAMNFLTMESFVFFWIGTRLLCNPHSGWQWWRGWVDGAGDRALLGTAGTFTSVFLWTVKCKIAWFDEEEEYSFLFLSGKEYCMFWRVCYCSTLWCCLCCWVCWCQVVGGNGIKDWKVQVRQSFKTSRRTMVTVKLIMQ